MKLEKVLEKLEELLGNWGIKSSDWILVSQYAYRLLGYPVKIRKGHFNILVRKEKIPWHIKEGVEIHPPRDSRFRTHFKNFIDKTGFDFDINLSSEKEFREKEGMYELYELPNKKKIRVQKPIGAIKEFEKLLSLSTEKGFGRERLDKDISYINDMIKVLETTGEQKTLLDFKKLLNKFLQAKKFKVKSLKIRKNEIYGIPASKGKAVGNAVVLDCYDDLRKLTKGDILVTQMTTPMCTPMLPGVAAIVTEKGGLLSHAAILAREMGIPCVVGTQIATKIIKTGDLLEVDAGKGLVRKLSS